jgi:hypothetical protein
MNSWWQSDRRIRKYEKLGDYSIEPWGEKYYALYKGDSLICVTVYKKGAVEVMKRLSEKEAKGGDLHARALQTGDDRHEKCR